MCTTEGTALFVVTVIQIMCTTERTALLVVTVIQIMCTTEGTALLVVTVIQIMCTTEGTALFEQSSLFFIVVYAFLVCYRKLFPCAINVAEV